MVEVPNGVAGGGMEVAVPFLSRETRVGLEWVTR